MQNINETVSLISITNDSKVKITFGGHDYFAPLWLVISIPIYIIFSIVFSCLIHKRLKRYFPQSIEKRKITRRNSTDSRKSYNSINDTNESQEEQIKKGRKVPLLPHKNTLKNEINFSQDLNQSIAVDKNICDHIKDRKVSKTNEDRGIHSKQEDVAKIKIHIEDLDHDDFDAFKRDDQHSFGYIRFLFGAIFLWWPRIIFMHICFISLVLFFFIVSIFTFNFSSYKIKKTSNCRYLTTWILIQLFISPMFWFLGFITCYKKRKDNKVKEIYQKYLGSDYDINQERHYATLISNHTGWVETFYWGWKHGCGFIAKKEIAHHPIMNIIMANIDCLLVDRESKESRESIANAIKQRQNMFYEKKTATPLLIYPEGTTTNGKYILNFKRGAFQSLLPIKPLYTKLTTSGPGINDTPMSSLEHFYLTFCFIWRICYFYELPVIECTPYMIKKYKINENELDCDVYARVVNNIYVEIFDLIPSDKTLKDLKKYENYCSLIR